MSAGEVLVAIVLVGGLVALLLFLLRSNWLTDPHDDEMFPPTKTLPRLDKPKPVAGWEWSNLQATDAQSLIAPDAYGTYIVRINDDGTFSVKKEPDVKMPAPIQYAEDVTLVEDPATGVAT